MNDVAHLLIGDSSCANLATQSRLISETAEYAREMCINEEREGGRGGEKEREREREKERERERE